MRALPALLLLLSCSNPTRKTSSGGLDSAQPGDDAGDTDDTVDTEDPGDDGDGGDTEDTDTGGDTDDEDTGGDTGLPDPEPQVVRFVAMGDGGEGNPDQYQVADAVATVCAAKATSDRAGCDFVLYLGDNFYNDGVTSVDDEQFQDKFELPYAELDLPFYVVLGNHDYGSTSLFKWQSTYEVEYSDHSDKWNMPDEYYQFQVEHAQFFGLDTNAIMLEGIWGDSGQDAWMRDLVATSTATWKIAFGHHPYISNGQHGSAGTYEGYDWLPIANGATVKAFMDDRICGQVDLYICGHDHNRQWLEPTCGTEFIVSGAAAKTTDLEDRGEPTFFEDDTTEGFVWIELRDGVMLGEFYDKDGNLDYSREITKPATATAMAVSSAGVAGR